MKLTFEDYNLANNNCRDFIKNVIDVLCAKRPLKEREENLFFPIIISNKIKNNEENGCFGAKTDSFDNFIKEIIKLFDPNSRNSGTPPPPPPPLSPPPPPLPSASLIMYY